VFKEKKPLPLNETIHVSEKVVDSIFGPVGTELKVSNTIEQALGAEGETVRVGVYKLDRIICVKKQVSAVQVKCE
jgi:hypothetical protein